MMDFYAVLDQVADLLRSRGRVSYRALKLQFDLDEAQLEALKDELVEVHQFAIDHEGRMLLWAGEAAASAPAPAKEPDQVPLAYTPAHLADKIRTARGTLEGERKQVTVFFADIKDSARL